MTLPECHTKLKCKITRLKCKIISKKISVVLCELKHRTLMSPTGRDSL